MEYLTIPFNYQDVIIVIGTIVVVILIALVLRAIYKDIGEEKVNLDEFNNWLTTNKISKKELSQQIGVRYDHTVQVLNGKKPLTAPFESSLRMYRMLHENENLIAAHGISASIVKNMRKYICNETERSLLSDPQLIETYKKEWDFAWQIIYDIIKLP